MSKLNLFLKERKEFIVLLALQTIAFLYVFGKKILHLNSIFFADSFDGSKNYFTYYYYTHVQQANNGFFEGMNYPFGEYIFYTDNTPVIAFLAKLLGLGEYSIGFYNAIFLLLWFLVPLVAYRIFKLLNIHAVIAIVFSLLICWTNPLLNHFGSTVNLSLFIFYLLALYFFLKHIKANELSSQLYYTTTQIVLIYIASFFHLYYLPIILLFLGGAYAVYILTTLKWNLAWQAILIAGISAVAVYGTIIVIDQYYDIRPEGAGGYGYTPYRNTIRDFISSLTYLNFPGRYQYAEWGQMKWTFLGNGYPLAILLSLLGIPFLLKRSTKQQNKIILSLLIGGIICALVSMGHTIDLYPDKTLWTNYFNPFYHVSKYTDFVTHFRYLRRFSAPFWMVYFICIAILSSAAWKELKQQETQEFWKTRLLKIYTYSLKLFVIAFILISSYDAMQYIQFHSINYKRESLFSKKHLDAAPDFTKNNFKAILPLPYFHVGSEINQYVIDDPDNWSRELYRLSIKNKLPLMACKMCRIPDSFTVKSFSVLEKETDPKLVKALDRKKVLLAVSQNHDWTNNTNPYVAQLKGRVDSIINKHNAQAILEKDGIAYYEMYVK